MGRAVDEAKLLWSLGPRVYLLRAVRGKPGVFGAMYQQERAGRKVARRHSAKGLAGKSRHSDHGIVFCACGYYDGPTERVPHQSDTLESLVDQVSGRGLGVSNRGGQLIRFSVFEQEGGYTL